MFYSDNYNYTIKNNDINFCMQDVKAVGTVPLPGFIVKSVSSIGVHFDWGHFVILLSITRILRQLPSALCMNRLKKNLSCTSPSNWKIQQTWISELILSLISLTGYLFPHGSPLYHMHTTITHAHTKLHHMHTHTIAHAHYTTCTSPSHMHTHTGG